MPQLAFPLALSLAPTYGEWCDARSSLDFESTQSSSPPPLSPPLQPSLRAQGLCQLRLPITQAPELSLMLRNLTWTRLDSMDGNFTTLVCNAHQFLVQAESIQMLTTRSRVPNRCHHPKRETRSPMGIPNERRKVRRPPSRSIFLSRNIMFS
jgi:hypothetical protein